MMKWLVDTSVFILVYLVLYFVYSLAVAFAVQMGWSYIDAVILVVAMVSADSIIFQTKTDSKQ